MPSLDGGLRSLVDQAVTLTEYAWVFRYPGDAPEPTAAEVEDGLTTATEVHRTILARLPAEVAG